MYISCMETNLLEYLQAEVLAASRDRLDHRWQSRDGAAPYARLYCVEEGEAWLAPLSGAGGRIALTPGMLVMIPEGTRYAFGCAGTWTVSWLHLRAILTGGANFFRAGDGICAFALANPARALRLFAQVRAAFHSAAPGRQLTVRGLALQLLGLYCDLLPPQRRERWTPGRERFVPVLRVIEEDYAQPLRVPQLAALAHYETASFAFRFKREFGCTPGEMVRRRRVAAAQRALLSTAHTLERIAAECGFTDAFHLSKVFKRYVGCAPSAYRAAGPALP